MNCLKFIVKHLLFLVNLVFTLVALAIIGVGSYSLHYVNNNEVLGNITGAVEVEGMIDFSDQILQYLCIAIIVLGCVVFLISFCGCCGSITENKCLLISYVVVMFLLTCASVFVLVVRSRIFDGAKEVVGSHINDTFHLSTNPVADEQIHAIQYTVKCCGPLGPDFYNETDIGILDEYLVDYANITINVTGVGLVSPSCCSTFNLKLFLEDPEDYVLNTFECNAEDVYEEGCVTKLLGYFDIAEKYIGIVVFVVTGVGVLAFLFGLYMCCSIKPKREKERQYYRY